MVCKTISIKSRQAGLTLVELLVATAISSIVGLGVASLVFYSGRSFAAIANYVELDYLSRITLDKMSREIRQANRLTASTSTSLTFEDYDGGVLTYVYDSAGKTLTRSKNGVADAKPLLTECDFLQFTTYQRNPVGGTYNQYPAATASTCKLVQLNWVCSRKIFGVPKNTESVQSAKIVIRKQ
jgi:prepilin-type N-terminal cleavage/methylation domain-containing protein